MSLLTQLDRRKEALYIAETIYKLDGDSFENRYNLAASIYDVTDSKDELEKALKLVKKCLEEKPQDQYSIELHKNLIHSIE